MDIRAVTFVLGNLLLVLALCLVAPLLVAVADADDPRAGLEIFAFSVTIATAVVLGLIGRYVFRSRTVASPGKFLR